MLNGGEAVACSLAIPCIWPSHSISNDFQLPGWGVLCRSPRHNWLASPCLASRPGRTPSAPMTKRGLSRMGTGPLASASSNSTASSQAPSVRQRGFKSLIVTRGWGGGRLSCAGKKVLARGQGISGCPLRQAFLYWAMEVSVGVKRQKNSSPKPSIITFGVRMFTPSTPRHPSTKTCPPRGKPYPGFCLKTPVSFTSPSQKFLGVRPRKPLCPFMGRLLP